jgi:WD40 repeat protein
MRLASQMLNSGDVFQLPDLLAPDQQPNGRALTSKEDCRGFEWWYLRQYSQEARPALAAHDGPLHLLAYSADGHALLTAGKSADGQALAVWDLVGGQPRWRHWLGAAPDFWSWSFAGIVPDWSIAAFAPGRGLLAVKTDSGTIALWDAETGSEWRHLPPQDVTRVSLSPDGRRLITGVDDGPLQVWDTATGVPGRPLPAATGPLAVAADGRTLVVGSHTGVFRGLQGWDLETGKPLWEAPANAGVIHLSCSPGGAYLLVITGDGQGAIWDARERAPLSWPQPFGAVRSLAISADERTVAAGDWEGGVRLWDVATRRVRARYRWQANPIVRLAFSPDGRSLAAASSAGVVYQMDATARTVPEALQPDLTPAPQVPVWSPDGKTLAVALLDNTIGLLDVPTRKVRAVLPGSPNFAVGAMAFSPDGRTLATAASPERVVRLWNAADGRLKDTTAPQPLPIESLAFSPDGRLATAAGATVRLWDEASLTESGVLESEFHLRQVAFTPDGRYLVAAGDGGLQVWALSAGQLPRQPCSYARLESAVSRLAVAPVGRRIAVGEANDVVEFWRLSREGELTRDRDLPPLRSWALRLASQRVLGLQFGPGGATLLTTLKGGNAALWNMPSGRHRTSVSGDLEYGALSPDGNVLAAIDREGALQLWDLRTWRVSRLPGQPSRPVTSLAFTADTTLLTGSTPPWRLAWTREWGARFDRAPLGSTAETVRLWDVATRREVIPSGLPPQETMVPPTIVAGSPDGRTVAAGCEDGGVWIWDRVRGRLLARFFVSDPARDFTHVLETVRALLPITNPDYVHHVEGVQTVAFSPDGNWLAVAGNRGSVRVWRTNDWKEPRTLPCDPGAVAWIGFAPDSSRLATAQGGRVRLWDTRTGEPAGTLGLTEESPILAGVFLPGGHRLATGSRDHIIRLWDLGTGKVTGRFVGHQDRVMALALTPDGKTLASGSWDRTVRLWSMADASAVATLEGHAGKVQALAFSGDGRVLASGSDTGEVLLWRAKRP